MTNSEGKAGRVKFTARTDYYPFRLKETAPVVQRAVAAVAAQGRTPNVRVTNGGLDANWLVRHGIPTVTFGAGQNEVHTVDEWINLTEFESACRLAVALATQGVRGADLAPNVAPPVIPAGARGAESRDPADGTRSGTGYSLMRIPG